VKTRIVKNTLVENYGRTSDTFWDDGRCSGDPHGSVFLSPHNDYAVTEYHGRSYQLALEKQNLKHCPTS